jgi:PAS domain S-box-containing protein
MPKVLIVDSGRGELRDLVPELEGRGHNVVLAPHGPEVEEIAEEGPPDLILSTVLMPPPPGFRLSGKVRRHLLAPQVPFGVYSPIDQDGDVLTRVLMGEEDVTPSAPETPVHPEKPSDRVRLDPDSRPPPSAAEATYTRLLLDNTLDGHILADRDGTVLHVNRPYCEMTGYSRDELLTMNIRNLEVGYTPSDLAQKIQSTVERGKVRFETRHRAKDGGLLDVEVQIAGARLGDESFIAAFVRDLSAEKKAQLERDYVWDLSADLLSISSFDGTFREVNPAWTEALGWSREELTSRPWMEFVHPDDRQRSMVETLRLRDGRPVLDFENRYRCKDGSYRVLSWNAIPTEDQSLIIAVARDITRTKEILTEIQDREERYRRLFESLPVSLWEADASWVIKALQELRADGVTNLQAYLAENPEFLRNCLAKTIVLDVNQATVSLWEGEGKEDFLGKLDQVASPLSHTVLAEMIEALYRGDSTFQGEGQTETLNGRPVDLLVAMHNLQQTENSSRLLVSLMNITARKAAVEALEERERQLATLFKNLPGVAYRCLNDEDWTMELVSDGCLDLTGYPAESLVGNRDLSWAEIIHPDDQDHVRKTVQSGIDGGHPFQIVYRICTAGGEVRWVWEQGELVGDPDSNSCRLEGFVADITQRVKAESAEQEARKELQALSRKLQAVREEERVAIARELHDELGQALTTLRMDLGLLREDLAPRDQQAVRELAAMEEKVETNLTMVQDLSARLRPPVLDVLGLGAALGWQADELAKRSPIRFEVDVPEAKLTLPAEVSTAVFRIAQEALTNAVRHAEATNVTLRLEEKTGFLALVIEDDGRGIQPEELTGAKSLGLLGMRERANALGGALDVRSPEGGGARVTFTVPNSSLADLG